MKRAAANCFATALLAFVLSGNRIRSEDEKRHGVCCLDAASVNRAEIEVILLKCLAACKVAARRYINQSGRT